MHRDSCKIFNNNMDMQLKIHNMLFMNKLFYDIPFPVFCVKKSTKMKHLTVQAKYMSTNGLYTQLYKNSKKTIVLATTLRFTCS